MAFIGGTFVATPHTVSGTTRFQQWVQRCFYLQKTHWTSLLLTSSQQTYSIHYQPSAAAISLLKKALTLPIRFIYFWPLEAAQQILKKHPRVPWSFLWLPAPQGTVSLVVYQNSRPLFCRTLPPNTALSSEIIPTQQYMKRFGYEKTMPLHIFIPTSLIVAKPLDPSLTFIAYSPPVITRPVAPFSIPELAHNQWLARLLLASQWLLSIFILLSSCGVGQKAWQLITLHQRQLVLQTTSPSLPSASQKMLFDALALYGTFWKIVWPTTPLADYRFEISEKLHGIAYPREIFWQHTPTANVLILSFDSNLSKADKTALTQTLKTLKFVASISWQKTQLHLGLVDHDHP